MIYRLPNIEVRIPFKTLFRSQKYLLKCLNEALCQTKLSDRMSIVILSYLLSVLEITKKKKIYYICQTQSRCCQIKQMCQTLYQYIKSQPFNRSSQSIDKFNLQRPQIRIISTFFHKQTNLIRDFHMDKYFSVITVAQYFQEIVRQKVKKQILQKVDYLFVETVAPDEIVQNAISGWINQIIIRRAYIQYQKLYLYYHQRDNKKYNKNQQQKSNSNQIKPIQSHIKHPTTLKKESSHSQLQIQKSSIKQEIKRQQQKSTQSNDIQSYGFSIKNIGIMNKKSSNSSMDIQKSISKQKLYNQWNINEIEKRINEVYISKKQQLQKKSDKKVTLQGQNGRTINSKQLGFEQQALIKLGIVGYVINFLQSYQILTRQSTKTNKDEQKTDQYSASKFLSDIKNKLLVSIQNMKKLYPIIKKLIQTYPPLIKVKQYNMNDVYFRKGRKSQQDYLLSTKHILHILKFFMDLIQFHQAFNQKYDQCIQVSRSCIKQKDKASFFEIKFKCFNQPLLTQIILQYNQNFVMLMNNGMSLQFYSSIFKPKILMKNDSDEKIILAKQDNKIISQDRNIIKQDKKITTQDMRIKTQDMKISLQQQIQVSCQKSFKFVFDSPSNVSQHVYTNLYGLNVSTTPSEQTLKIPQFLSKQDDQHDLLILKAYGVFLYDICQIISDGIVVYFPSMAILNRFRKEWLEKEDIYRRINQVKKIFLETEYQQDNQYNVKQYIKTCDIGRGAVFLITANGGMAKYTTFNHHYSTCVIFIGFPKSSDIKKRQNLSQKQKQQKRSRQSHFNIKQAQLQTFYGLKTTAKCLSNCINSSTQPKCVIFADVTYTKLSTKRWFPYIQQGNLNTDQAIEKIKKFNQLSQKFYEQLLAWEMGKISRPSLKI